MKKREKKIRASEFDYYLPEKLIAQKPTKPRDKARLLILERNTITSPPFSKGEIKRGSNKTNFRITHQHFYDLEKILNAGDVLVLNNSKVIPARLVGKKKTGGKIEIFLLCHPDRARGEWRDPFGVKQRRDSSTRPDVCLAAKSGLGRNDNVWQCLIGGKAKVGDKIYLGKNKFPLLTKEGVRGRFIATIIKKLDEQSWLVAFNVSDKELFSIGETPTPPYIKKSAKLSDYQTIYAKFAGSVAAPTAGLHFTKSLLNKLKKKGVQVECVTLHVGLGTFSPVKSEYIQDHKMHAELATIDKYTANKLNRAKQEGRRIVAVGTTSVRTLEAFSVETHCHASPRNNADKNLEMHINASLQPGSRWINIFIYPGYEFKFVDAIITNFHLPKSTLLMLISAFAGQKNIKRAYAEAIKKKYKFYSFGDAMMIK
ncbi:MAG: tRNA preQ1(34) S-adenosylmethionine ribosyltransferase-isomerase QueA [Patescibacteria group bacterium]